MKIFDLITNRFKKFPNPKTIDQSGIVKSNHPVKGNGWIKGWVVNSDTVIVCKHSNPSTSAPNNKVFVTDSAGVEHERTIIRIDKAPFDIGTTDVYYDGGDIAICKLDSPFPSTVKAYGIYTKSDVYGLRTVTVNQHGEFSIGKLTYRGKYAYLKGSKRNIQLIPGDSGLPWFVYDGSEWKVVTHTYRGMYGEGPWYGKIYNELQKRINLIR